MTTTTLITTAELKLERHARGVAATMTDMAYNHGVELLVTHMSGENLDPYDPTLGAKLEPSIRATYWELHTAVLRQCNAERDDLVQRRVRALKERLGDDRLGRLADKEREELEVETERFMATEVLEACAMDSKFLLRNVAEFRRKHSRRGFSPAEAVAYVEYLQTWMQDFRKQMLQRFPDTADPSYEQVVEDPVHPKAEDEKGTGASVDDASPFDEQALDDPVAAQVAKAHDVARTMVEMAHHQVRVWIDNQMGVKDPASAGRNGVEAEEVLAWKSHVESHLVHRRTQALREGQQLGEDEEVLAWETEFWMAMEVLKMYRSHMENLMRAFAARRKVEADAFDLEAWLEALRQMIVKRYPATLLSLYEEVDENPVTGSETNGGDSSGDDDDDDDDDESLGGGMAEPGKLGGAKSRGPRANNPSGAAGEAAPPFASIGNVNGGTAFGSRGGTGTGGGGVADRPSSRTKSSPTASKSAKAHGRDPSSSGSSAGASKSAKDHARDPTTSPTPGPRRSTRARRQSTLYTYS